MAKRANPNEPRYDIFDNLGPTTELQAFICESNRIEGIRTDGVRLKREEPAYEAFLALSELSIENLVHFVAAVQPDARLRDKPGMDVWVGDHIPPMGGPDVADTLEALLIDIRVHPVTPYHTHVCYETLHPFMDGNGRSGRVLWLWMHKQRSEEYYSQVILPRGFLHSWYYESLQNSR